MMNQSFPQVQAYLLFIRGPRAQQTFPVGEQETWIGSDPQCQISISDPSLQPWHARLIWNKGRLFIQSYQQSLVTVNQQSISDASFVQDGDEVSLGQAGISFRLQIRTDFQQSGGIHTYQPDGTEVAPHQNGNSVSSQQREIFTHTQPTETTR